MGRAIQLVTLICCWWLWSGMPPGEYPITAGLGLVSCLLVVWLSGRMARASGPEPSHHLGLRPLLYLPWLILEIVKSNLHVARVILTPSLPISPQLIRVPATQKSDVGQVLYANSITLTPGTISLDLRANEILVHALTSETAAGVATGEMDRKVTALERSS